MTVVAVLALDGVIPFELSVPGQVFGTANQVVDDVLYDVRVCAPGRTATTAPAVGGFALTTAWDLDALGEADLIVVPGHDRYLDPPAPALLAALRDAHGRGARLASVCVGAFTLAATGLLADLRVTTHWRCADELARRHPDLHVDSKVLFVDNGSLVTSAGVAAGLDLFLHLVGQEQGATVAAATARHTVMPLQRDGGQAQFIDHPRADAPGGTLGPTLDWMRAELARPLTLDEIARHAAMSVRTLNRRFRAQVGTTPLQWLLRLRIDEARQLLEATDLPVEHIAARTGFGSPTTLRHHFARATGTAPSAYRTTFRGGSHQGHADLLTADGPVLARP
ncbi:GlxA family transcriptional regulator [Streptomyces liangshanensis]|uniref:Helix-turn-helix domain-containing protein n=1 Tax=Streptomyces liangshanensis TaxID=2717324 RepID=A0A6G9GV66_9ACTN|nr:helix-turn-helix domain-containing protein [Streptomyces liangshanensis]QIQ02162.1 helix-turn-helix domain-containing protein [Streptomyces liangshanensis]